MTASFYYSFLLVILTVPSEIKCDEIPADVLRAVEDGNISRLRSYVISSSDPMGRVNSRINGPGTKFYRAEYPQNDTILMLAIRSEQIFAFRYLLKQGANPLMVNADGETALSFAVRLTASAAGLHMAKSLLGLTKANLEWEQKDGCTPLLLAVNASQSNQYAMVQLLLESGANMDVVSFNGYTVLHFAAQNGQTALIRVFLDRGLGVDANDAGIGQTALFVATKYGHNETVASLLQWGANVNHTTNDRQSPLTLAATKLDIGLMRQLLIAGADASFLPNVTSVQFNSSAFLEFYSHLFHHPITLEMIDDVPTWLKLANSLAELEAEKNATSIDFGKNIHSSTILGYAAENGFSDIVQLLVAKGANVNISGPEGGNALFWAVLNGDNELVEYLLRSGIDVNKGAAYGVTPLMVAAGFGHIKIAKALLHYGADATLLAEKLFMFGLDSAISYYPSPLFSAIYNGHLDMLKLLVAAGVTINNDYIYTTGVSLEIRDYLADRFKVESLDAADIFTEVAKGDVDKVRQYLESDAGRGKINTTRLYNNTMLMQACKYGQLEMARFLIDNGADVLLRNNDGKTALHVVYAPDKPDDPITPANVSLELTKLLLNQSKENINWKDRLGTTPLMAASGSFRIPEGLDIYITSAQLLLESGAEVEGALMNAIERENVQTARLLIEHRANVNARSKRGETPLTPLTLSIYHNRTSATEFANLLIDAGASLTQKGIDHKTPLELAAKYFYDGQELIKVLIKHGALASADNGTLSNILNLAALSGNSEICLLMLQNGANINGKDQNGSTPLIMSVSQPTWHINKDQTVLDMLISMGADCLAANNAGETALHRATVFPSNADAVVFSRVLLNCSKVNLNWPRSDGTTPLISALRAIPENVKLVELLLMSGADVNMTDNSGLTALDYAAKFGFNESTALLLQYGAGLDSAAIKWAVRSSVTVIQQLLQARVPISPGALSEAIYYNRIDIARFLLEKGAQVDVAEPGGKGPLFVLAESTRGNYKDAMELLQNYSANIDIQDKENRTPLIAASAAGNDKMVERLLDAGARTEAKSIYNTTALHFAAQNGFYRIAEVLLNRGANLSAQNNSGETPLILAAKSCSSKTLSTLVTNYGADISSKDKRLRWDPLIWTVAKCNKSIVSLVIELGADINSKDNKGNTALTIAANLSDVDKMRMLIDRGGKGYVNSANKENSTSLVYISCCNNKPDAYQLLLEKGADFNWKNMFGRNSFLEAAYYGQTDIIKLFLSSPLTSFIIDMDGQDNEGNTAFAIAVKRCYFGIALLLHKNLADINAGDRDGNSPLIWAASENRYDNVSYLVNNIPLKPPGSYVSRSKLNLDAKNLNGDCALGKAAMLGNDRIVRLLIEKGATLDLANKNGNTPLLLAAGKVGNSIVVGILLDNKANIYLTNHHGDDSLMVASSLGDLPIVDQLLQHRADLKVSNELGETALLMAARNGHIGVVQRLIEKGAAVNAEATDGTTPLIAAAINGHFEIVSYLVEKEANASAQANGTTAINFASRTDSFETVKLLISLGQSVNAIDGDMGRTPLMHALLRGNQQIIDILLANGSDVNARESGTGNTAVILLAEKGDLDSIKLLIQNGASVSLANSLGDTALSIAAQKGFINITRFVIDNGASVNVSNANGRTPLMNAAEAGHMDVVQELVQRKADILVGDNDQVTAVLLASWTGFMDIVEYLIQNGARRAGCTICFYDL